MYLQNHIDWSHPLFRRWKLPEKFTKAQSEAFLDANEDEVNTTFSLFLFFSESNNLLFVKKQFFVDNKHSMD